MSRRKKQKYVYKVVRVDANGEFVSVYPLRDINDQEHSCTYKIGEKQKGWKHSPGPFVFNTMKNAQNFAYTEGFAFPHRILWCIYTGDMIPVTGKLRQYCGGAFEILNILKTRRRRNFPQPWCGARHSAEVSMFLMPSHVVGAYTVASVTPFKTLGH